MTENGVKCRRDGKPMYFVEETEKLSNGEYRIVFSYKCLACGYTINVEQVSVKKKGGNLLIIRRLRPIGSTG